MKKYRLQAGSLLLTVFTAILLYGSLLSTPHQTADSDQQAVIHVHKFSGEAPGNISRSFTEGVGFEGRIFQDFINQTLEEFHSSQSHTGYARVNFIVAQFKAPDKVYKRIQKFLI
jgi:hypothetical protein